MTTVDVIDTICRHYLDLCPMDFQQDAEEGLIIRLDMSRGQDLCDQYGDFTIIVELLNQLAVQAVRRTFQDKVRANQRYIPASIRAVRLGGLHETHRVFAKPTQLGGFYQVRLRGERIDKSPTSFGGNIIVACIDEGQQ
ncbi:hypothetical protein [Pseudovibrio sp. WM33]|uniref:hypothetical protein n=1 Tax=Pseudovibrio sp. WM33 TaxID=1735585 RepID=UPI0007AEC5DE|nr:hypothetical protein [Pseudovibrio sp. WM33]KZL24685.1 hypothetical protein PsWM33_02359 [Pseudovibrio sp. WM33]